MRRRLLALTFALVALISVQPHAAGTLTVTTADLGGGVTRYTLAWTSTAGGAVSSNAFSVKRGDLIQAKFVPGSPTPSNLYDVTLVDQDGFDVLDGLGANLSNTSPSVIAGPTPPIGFVDGTQTLDLVVANAGSAKAGTVTLWVR
jgi:hypothetical protein